MTSFDYPPYQWPTFDLPDSVTLPVRPLSSEWVVKPKVDIPDRPAKLYATIGTQRSGKTTEGRKWLRHQPNQILFSDDGFPRYLWDSDFLRLELHGQRWAKPAEPMVWAIKNYAIRAALAAGHDTLACGTHTTKASVRRLLEIDADCGFVIIDTPLEVCIERAYKTGQDDLVAVIPRLYQRVQEIKAMGLDSFIESVREDIRNDKKY